MHPPPYPHIPYSLCKLSGLYNEATPLPSAATLYCRSPNEMDAVATPSFDWQLSRGKVRWGEVRGSGLGAIASWSAISRRDSIEIFTRRVFSSHNSLSNCHWQFKNATSCCSCVAVIVVRVLLLLFVVLLLFVIVNTRFSYCLFHLFISQTSRTVHSPHSSNYTHRT